MIRVIGKLTKTAPVLHNAWALLQVGDAGQPHARIEISAGFILEHVEKRTEEVLFVTEWHAHWMGRSDVYRTAEAARIALIEHCEKTGLRGMYPKGDYPGWVIRDAAKSEQEPFQAWTTAHIEGCHPDQTADTRWNVRLTPTGIDTSIGAVCVLCGAEKNCSDYSLW